ncbi:MAG: O-antigen ligase family protein [Marinosulfonomonas sp.]
MSMNTSFTLGLGRLGTVPFSLELLLGATAIGALVFEPAVGSIAAAIYLLAGLCLIALHPTEILSTMIRQWYLLLLPFYCMTSAIWSNYPAISFRFGIQLTITFVIALVLARLMSARQFCFTLFVMLGIAMLCSILFGRVRSDIGAWAGIYGSKNSFAAAGAIFALVSMSVALDHTRSLVVRAAGLGASLVGVALVALAQSTGALLLLLPALVVAVLMKVIPQIKALHRIVIFLFGALFTVLILLLVVTNYEMLMAMLLDSTGKDITLTGRTDLWAVAWDFIKAKPLLGVGYKAFWVQGFAPAEALWLYFGIEGRGGFNFHNMYMSNTVDIGIIGMGMQILVFYGATILNWRVALTRWDASAVFFFSLLIMTIAVSFIEVPLFAQFQIRTLVVVCSFGFALKALKETR